MSDTSNQAAPGATVPATAKCVVIGVGIVEFPLNKIIG